MKYDRSVPLDCIAFAEPSPDENNSLTKQDWSAAESKAERIGHHLIRGAASERPTAAPRLLPQRTGGQRFGPLTCCLAAFFVIAGPLRAASQPESRPAPAPFFQQGSKLVGTFAAGLGEQGWSVALSADSNTAIVGGLADNKITGAAWVYTRSGGVWAQQGDKLVGTGAVGSAAQGFSVALSEDGNAAIIGGPFDNGRTGAMWVFTRSGGVWTQQGNKLVGTGAVGNARQGVSIALSADGSTAVVGGPADNADTGAAWVFIRNGGVWIQQGNKLVGTGAVGSAGQGVSVALSTDGNTAIVGGLADNKTTGAAWVYRRNGNAWTQQGNKLVGTGAVGAASQGFSVALSGDGSTAIMGGPRDHADTGAAWVFARSGDVWTQQGNKLVGTGAVGAASQGSSVALSGDGSVAIMGGVEDNSYIGAAWIFIRGRGVWNQQGSKLVGTDAIGNARQGHSVALSGDGSTAMVGGLGDDRVTGAAWVFTRGSGVWITPPKYLSD